jgi:hypothetical protein
MATRKFVDGYVQPFTRDPPLEFDRKEPIVAPGDHAYRNLGPCFKVAGLTKDDVSLGALVRLALLDDLGWNVMHEVGGEINIGAVPAAVRSRSPRRDRSRVVPPLSRRLARDRDHRIDQHQHAHCNLLTYQRGGETAERLRDKDHAARPNRLDDAIGVNRKAGLLVITREIDCDRYVLGFFKELHDTVPIPCNTTRTRNEYESCHAYNLPTEPDTHHFAMVMLHPVA